MWKKAKKFGQGPPSPPFRAMPRKILFNILNLWKEETWDHIASPFVSVCKVWRNLGKLIFLWSLVQLLGFSPIASHYSIFLCYLDDEYRNPNDNTEIIWLGNSHHHPPSLSKTPTGQCVCVTLKTCISSIWFDHQQKHNSHHSWYLDDFAMDQIWCWLLTFFLCFRMIFKTSLDLNNLPSAVLKRTKRGVSRCWRVKHCPILWTSSLTN